jgi:adenylate kinase
MDPAAVRNFSRQAAAYLEENEIYDLFESLLKTVILHQPDDPLQFMIDTLKQEVKVKVILMGPPGIQRSEYARNLATQFKVPHVQASSLIKSYLAEHSGDDSAAAMVSGSFVRDDLAIAAVVPHLEKMGNSGYILDGFPRTRGQALALQHAKIVPDKVVLLNAPSATVEGAYATKLDVKEPGDDAVTRRTQQFLRHLLHTVEVYASSVQQLDVDGLDYAQVNEELTHLVSLRPQSNAPLRPARVCVLGPLGSGRTQLSKRLAQHYGAVHVDTTAIVRGMKEEGLVGPDVLVEDVPDADLCAKIRARLDQHDCARKGWILDGFPLNRQQAAFLPGAHLSPARVMHITVPEDVCFKRIAVRKYDPVTGLAYYGPPANVTIRQRLRQDKMDKPEIVKKRFEMHAKNIAEVQTAFARCFNPVRGDVPEVHVYEKACDFIDRPLAE